MASLTSYAKPVATVTVAPTGGRATSPRDHSVTLKLELSAQRPRYSDKEHVMDVARRALEIFAPTGERDRERGRLIREVSVTTHSRKTGSQTVVVGVEGSASWAGRPGDDAVAGLRERVLAEGYRVAALERRECAAPECKVEALVEWGRVDEVPRGWHSATICGGHNYRTCAKCKTVYALTSQNSVGPAPSVHCEVCGLVIVEWGSSKIWDAQLVSKSSSNSS